MYHLHPGQNHAMLRESFVMTREKFRLFLHWVKKTQDLHCLFPIPNHLARVLQDNLDELPQQILQQFHDQLRYHFDQMNIRSGEQNTSIGK